MTNPGEDAGGTASSDAGTGAAEPSSAGQEAPPIEQSSWEQPGYSPPPAYPPAGGYEAPQAFPPPGGYPPPDYPQPSYPPPGYPSQPYAEPPGYGAPSYPPPPPYGTQPPYGSPPAGYGPPQGGYPGYSGYPGGYGQPAQGTNALAIGSLVAAVIGVLCGIGSIIGIVLGVVALNQIKQSHEGGKGLAIAGIAVGAVSLLINIVWTIGVLNS